MEETGDKVSFGFTFPFLTISTNEIIDYASYRPCDETHKQVPCLERGEKWGQQRDIIETTLGHLRAKSFYIAGDYPYAPYNEDSSYAVYHIIQTNSAPKIEAKMFVSGQGFDLAFKQMLSTFKILDSR